MASLPERILVTGANGNLGRQLIGKLGDVSDGAPGPAVRALVRSEGAASRVRAIATARPPEVVIGDYTDPDFMAEAASGCGGIVHLVGIIKEGRGASYRSAHEETCRVLEASAARGGARRIVYLSILGAQADSANPCLASKGRAADLLLEGRVPTTLLRVPMVLGPDDFASASLRGQGQAGWVSLIGGGTTLQQPIDSRDVVSGILAALADGNDAKLALDLCGPECLSHRELLARVARLHNRSPRIVHIPKRLARFVAGALQRFSGNPPLTPAMLDILQHDDCVEGNSSCERLGIGLTPLDETLRTFAGPETRNHD